MSDLVQRLSEGTHAVEVSLRPEKSLNAFKECIDRSYVHIKFTGTRGGTELGVKLDPASCNFDGVDFTQPVGQVRLAGTLTLDYVNVRCIADIGLATLTGKGHLEILAAEPAEAVA